MHPTHRPDHLALSADFPKMSLSSPVHIVCIDCSQSLFYGPQFDFNDHFLKLDNETKLINLMVVYYLRGKYNRIFSLGLFISSIQ